MKINNIAKKLMISSIALLTLSGVVAPSVGAKRVHRYHYRTHRVIRHHARRHHARHFVRRHAHRHFRRHHGRRRARRHYRRHAHRISNHKMEYLISRKAFYYTNHIRKEHGLKPFRKGNVKHQKLTNIRVVKADRQYQEGHYSDKAVHDIGGYWFCDNIAKRMGLNANLGENACGSWLHSHNPNTIATDNIDSLVYHDASSNWGHRKNILSRYSTHMTISVVRHKNNSVTIVQNFYRY